MKRITLLNKQRTDLGYGDPTGSKLVGRVNGLSIYLHYFDENDFLVNVMDMSIKKPGQHKYKVAMDLDCGPGHAPGAAHVDMVRVDKEYQGMQLAPKVYRKLMQKLPNLVFQAGTVQSPGGRSIWATLATYPDIFVFGGLRSKPHTWEQLDSDEDLSELYSDNYDMYRKPSFVVFAMSQPIAADIRLTA